MAHKVIHRPARGSLPEVSVEAVELPAPPVVGSGGSSSGMAMRVLMPLMGAVGAASMLVSNSNPLRMMAGGAMVAAAVLGGVAALVFYRSGARKQAAHDRARYVRFVRETRVALEADARVQREAARYRHPAPGQLTQVVRDPLRVWERRRWDVDFLVVRAGFGSGELSRPVVVRGKENPLQPNDPVAQAQVDRLVARSRSVTDLPLAVPLRGVVSIVGPQDSATELLRSMMMQVAALHAPDDVRIHLCLGGEPTGDYEWMTWLPHLLDVRSFDGPIGRRMTSRSPEELSAELDEHIRRRIAARIEQLRVRPGAHAYTGDRLLILAPHGTAGLDPLALIPAPYTPAELGICVITSNERRRLEPGHVDVRVTTAEDRTCSVEQLTAALKRPGDNDIDARDERLALGARSGVIDDAPIAVAAGLARYLAPMRLAADPTPDAPLETVIELDRLLGIHDFGTYDIADMWNPRTPAEFLNVPIGLDSAGAPIRLDIKESGQQGMGPHGLCIGATGSGKSEVLRTLVLSLAVAHPPHRLAFVLVDYKGGAAFAGLDDLPHTTAMVSNLADDAGLVDRLHDALLGEMQRRQRMLQDAGSLPNVTAYNDRREAGHDLPPLPNLFVVIDEFGEILSAKPDFIDLFVQIGRIGRSIGVHLLLATQRLEEGRLRGLESHLSYRIGLRTFTAQESRTALGVPDAHALPPVPGSGILKVDPDIFTRFKAAYVSGVYEPTEDRIGTELPPVPMPFGLFNDTESWLADQVAAGATVESAPREVDRFAATTLDVVVTRMREAAAKIQQIWLPPLPTILDFATVLGEFTTTPDRGLTTVEDRPRGSLRIPIGLLDKPLEQWQGALELDLRAAGGNVCILGAPQSGKTGAVRSLIVGAALTHTPREICFYAVDLGGAGLSMLAPLPHVGGIATRFEPDRIRRTVAEVMTHLAQREQVFARHRLNSADDMRRRLTELPELEVADIFLIIDGWTSVRDDYEDLLPVLQEIGTRGLGFGIHLVVTSGRWADLRLPMQAIMGTKIELRLNDPLDSTISRKLVENIKPSTPGRCITGDKLLAQIGLPILRPDTGDTSGQALDETVRTIAAAWTGPRAPEVRMLPEILDHREFRDRHPGIRPVLLGVDEAALAPVALDFFTTDQHLLVFGDAESGKTNLARLIIDELTAAYTDDQVVFGIFDTRRTLLDAAPEQYVGAYAGTSSAAAGMAGGIAAEVAKRLPPDDLTPTQLRNRSWWSGPEIFVIADDFELLSPSGPGPLAPLLPYLPQARDLGLHLIVLRRSGGVSRALFEPIIQTLKENGATGVLLSGDRQEGQIWPGAAMSTQPPGRGLLIRRGQPPQRFHTAYRGDSATPSRTNPQR